MYAREAVIYYDYLANEMDELSGIMNEIREELLEHSNVYLQTKLVALTKLYSQLSSLTYDK